uniref:Uncharacterized protein n=1 Tax=Chromera velia CCMP2878 TaxID=1169474 RepID=A0A0G4HQM0_9ALVE|mmetsp:Transcript_55417/g.108484  ORF Transcript_55417/g.108484 Transcript_55417/m.108484 type:complete len:111 (+) Transcript_55417:324-656(+)|eukprot:Cvel_30184.t1-p1 / transcript=Cvel_30184.t1 / gene=Cvel_30184 / organism=Chromera_velia_CCMP2878 / gene_product=hypothetical protein / transcript_product=hypothetical protein / location=Cvel_scaffold4267:3177-5042(+) / protein_length=110 / sequence_SO=supercontig / SO=protein_coding / is_pseudo=false
MRTVWTLVAACLTLFAMRQVESLSQGALLSSQTGGKVLEATCQKCGGESECPEEFFCCPNQFRCIPLTDDSCLCPGVTSLAGHGKTNDERVKEGLDGAHFCQAAGSSQTS